AGNQETVGKAVTRHHAFPATTPATEARSYPARLPSQAATAQSKLRKGTDNQALNKVLPPLPRPALMPDNAPTATFSRDLPHRGELGSAQHKKIVYTYSARPPPVASALHAFYAHSKEPPPSKRGLGYSQLPLKPTGPQGDISRDFKSSFEAAGPSKGHAESSHRHGAGQGPSQKLKRDVSSKKRSESRGG
ncbi:hypothetical protein CVT26_001233, partial [Gymnopilus dilepis]